MQDYCPLCMRNGIKKKVKLLQINMQEAVWTCEGEKCIWPFGYEEFTFFPRTVGKIWSCYWDSHKPMTRTKESIVPSMEPAQCSAPVTASENLSEEFVSNNLSEHVPMVNFSSMDTEGRNYLDDIDLDIFMQDNNQVENQESNNISSTNASSTNKLVECNGIKISKPTKVEANNSINLVNPLMESSPEDEENLDARNIQNTNCTRGIPKITSIQKANIDISNVKIANQILIHQDSEKKVENEKDIQLSPNNLAACQNIVKTEAPDDIKNINESKTLKSNLNVTTIKIDSLPPIKLSYELPTCKAVSAPLVPIAQINSKGNLPTKTKNLPNRTLKKCGSSGKTYEKFSFSAIKKKIDTSNTNNTDASINSLIPNTPNSDIVEDVDSVLEDLLSENYNVPDDVNDLWIGSLLN